jgi:uncharacterized damage-inducible protein DinB
VAAQDSRNPVSDALGAREQRHAKNLVEAAQDMPAEKYGFKPTPAQLSFADVVVHLADGNDYFCSTIAGQPAPQRPKLVATAAKDALVARLKETFDFCSSSLANVTDATLADSVPWFGNRKVSRANAVIVTVDDWADHYSQVAIYLRLNGLLPPTAKSRS